VIRRATGSVVFASLLATAYGQDRPALVTVATSADHAVDGGSWNSLRRNGRASEVAVADSSLVYALDEAAKRFVKDQRFTTNCPGTRFDVRMRFRLRDRYQSGAT
jgi:hypothetical protein